MFAQVNHGVPKALWDQRNPPLRGLPDGRTVSDVRAEAYGEARQEAIQHAKASHPYECCGAFVRPLYGPDTGLRYHALTNVHPDRENAFQVDPLQMQELMLTHRVEGIHHSHPHGNPHDGGGFYPSHADMECQLTWQIPFYVTVLGKGAVYYDFFGWGDQLPVPPFRGRDFRNGVTDCFALARQVMGLVYGKLTPDFPRHPDWWEHADENPFLTYFNQSGFECVTLEDLQPGDGLIYAFRGGVPGHCAVYIGSDLLIHHLSGRLSKIDPVAQWRRQFYMAVRYAPGADTQPGERISGDGNTTEEGGPARPPSGGHRAGD